MRHSTHNRQAQRRLTAGAVLAVIGMAACSGSASQPVVTPLPSTIDLTVPTAQPSSLGSPAPSASTTAFTPLQLLWEKSGPAQAHPGTFWPAVDPATGEVWVASPWDNAYWIFKPDGTYVRSFGSGGTGNGQFDLVSHHDDDGLGAIAFAPDGSFFVADVDNRRVQKFDETGRYLLQWGGFGTQNGQFVSPKGISTDGKVVYVADDSRNDIQVFDTAGHFIRSIDVESIAAVLGPNGHLYAQNGFPTPEGEQEAEYDPMGKLVHVYPTQRLTPAFLGGGHIGQVAVERDGTVIVPVGDRQDPTAPCLIVKITAAGEVAGSWSVGESCETIALAPDEKAIYVASSLGVDPSGSTLRKYALP
jgi:DNA-binding beta-propeller fold protein YncE